MRVTLPATLLAATACSARVVSRDNPLGEYPNEVNSNGDLITNPSYIFSAVETATNSTIGWLNAYSSENDGAYATLVYSSGEATPGFGTWLPDAQSNTIDFPSNSSSVQDSTIMLCYNGNSTTGGPFCMYHAGSGGYGQEGFGIGNLGNGYGTTLIFEAGSLFRDWLGKLAAIIALRTAVADSWSQFATYQ